MHNPSYWFWLNQSFFIKSHDLIVISSYTIEHWVTCLCSSKIQSFANSGLVDSSKYLQGKHLRQSWPVHPSSQRRQGNGTPIWCGLWWILVVRKGMVLSAWGSGWTRSDVLHGNEVCAFIAYSLFHFFVGFWHCDPWGFCVHAEHHMLGFLCRITERFGLNGYHS